VSPAISLILRYTGMRRESVATLRVRNIGTNWGLRNVSVKGGKTRDIPIKTRSFPNPRRTLTSLG
jgi:site-specific recombinase XerD